ARCSLRGRAIVEHDVDAVVLDRDWKRPHVVGERVKRAAAFEVESRVMPVTCEQTVAHGAAIQWETHVRTAVVDGKETPIVGKHCDAVSTGADQRAPASAQLGNRSYPNPLGNQCSHM